MCLLLGGCEDGEIRAYSAPKDVSGGRPMQMAQASPTQEPEIIEWTLPPGWREIPGEGMRYATMILEEGSAGRRPLELRVTPLGLAARDPLANINRWREQIGLGHIGPQEMNDLVRTFEIDGRTAHVVNVSGPAEAGRPAQQVLGAILPGDQRVWFFLVMDDAERVGRFATAFEEFLHSLRFRESQVAMPNGLPPGHPPIGPGDATQGEASAPGTGAGNTGAQGDMGAGGTGRVDAAPGRDIGAGPGTGEPGGAAGGAAASGEARMRWTTPAGWREHPGDGSFRVASFDVEDASGRAEVTITRFPGGVGGLLANINRWRGQVGLEPVADVSAQPLETLEVDSQPAQLLDLAGPAPPGTGDASRQRILAVLVPRSDLTWFLKMTGPKGLLDKHKRAFVDFARSVRFDGMGS